MPPPPPAYQPPPAPPPYGGPVPPGGWQQPPATRPGIPTGKPLASWGARLGAYLIDGLVLLVPAAILFFALVGGAVGLSGDDEDVVAGAAIGAMLLWFLLMAVIYMLYAPLLMARQGERNGQTWGKQLMNVRGVRTNGYPIKIGPAALR